ncbi:hypothetical protein [Streptomyces sp. NPDC003996]
MALRLRGVNGLTDGAQGLAWPFDAKQPGLLLRKSPVMTATAPAAMNIGAFFQSVTSTSLGVGGSDTGLMKVVTDGLQASGGSRGSRSLFSGPLGELVFVADTAAGALAYVEKCAGTDGEIMPARLPT